jgi:hypothetical protein
MIRDWNDSGQMIRDSEFSRQTGLVLWENRELLELRGDWNSVVMEFSRQTGLVLWENRGLLELRGDWNFELQ